MQFRLLGPLHVLRDRAPVSLGGPKQRALLGYLLLRHGRFASREELIEALWGERPPQSAVGSLHVYVHGLRRVLGADRIEARGTAYRVRVERDELDLARFEELSEEGRRRLAAGETERAASHLQAALELWQGPALGDLPPDLLGTERLALEESRLATREQLVETDLARGQYEKAIADSVSLIAEHPFRERPRELQILALYRGGRQKDALEAYRVAREVLVDELGIEPGPRLRELEGAILRQEPGLLPAPEKSPTATAAEISSQGLSALPVPPTRLIGRQRELDEIEGIFREDGAQLVTLTGPGGIGKTRLALAVAERLARQLPDGARFVDFSALSEPELLLPTIASELDVPAGTPLGQALAQGLRPLRILLLLDNLEHLLAATTVLSDLLAAAPGLLMLVTSRAPLRLRAEHDYPVPPLGLPADGAGLATIAESAAVQLLVERSRAVNRSYALTEASAPAFAAICRRLDGLPLALELAASRMRGLSPETVAASLGESLELLVEGPRDLPARQRTLRATLEWSHRQLGESESTLFAQLAGFAGSFTVEDVTSVCGADSAGPLAALAEVNLVRQLEPECFVMLQTIRQFAAEQLQRSGESDAVRSRHCRHYLRLAERAHDAVLAGGEGARPAYAALERAHDNLREALTWAAQAGEVELEVRLACALRQFWLVRGHLAEGRTFFERAVAAAEGGNPLLRAQALMHGGPFLYRQGELDRARAWWEEALAILTEQGDGEGAARCAGELGAVAFSEGDLRRASELFERSAAGFEALDDRMRLGIVRANQAEVAALRGDLAAAIEHAEEAASIGHELADLDALALALHTVGRLRSREGHTSEAKAAFAECLACAREIGYREVLANCVQAAAELALADKADPEPAARLLAVARQSLAEIGAPVQGLEAESFARAADALEQRVDPERLRAIQQEAAEVELEAVLDEALALLQVAPAPVTRGTE